MTPLTDAEMVLLTAAVLVLAVAVITWLGWPTGRDSSDVE